jgi:hypothetical protein
LFLFNLVVFDESSVEEALETLSAALKSLGLVNVQQKLQRITLFSMEDV